MERSVTSLHTAQHTTPTRSVQFYDALTQAVADALAAYPSEKCTIRRAADLVLNGKVTLLDGVVTVASQSTPGNFYQPNGQCECKHFQYSPSGFCTHRMAAALYKRAMRGSLLAPLPAHWTADYSVAARDACMVHVVGGGTECQYPTWQGQGAEAVNHARCMNGAHYTSPELTALVCSPEHQLERALSGFAVTPDGRAGLAARS